MKIRIITSFVLLLSALAAPGCQTASEKPEIKYSTLPTREVHAVYPIEFNSMHETCQHVLRDQLNYESVSSTKDETTGKGRIDAGGADGASVRVETARSRDLESTSVGVLAVEPGASEPSEARAREILQRIEQALWPFGK